MAISDVTVNITIEKVVQQLNFGIPLIMTAGVTSANESPATTHAYAEYSSVREVEEVFGNADIITTIAKLIFAQENCPEKIACCSTTADNVAALKAVADQNWRQVILTSLDWTGQTKDLTDVFDWCEENKRVIFTSTNSTTKFADMAAKKMSYHHVCIMYYDDKTEQVVFPEAALVGATAGKEVGSFTYKNQILTNVLPMVLTSSELETYHNAGCITIVTKAGDIVTSEGKAFSGQFLDITDSKDWLEQQIRYKVQKVLNNNEKVDYDDNGINLIDSAVVSVLKEAYNNGMIADDEDGMPTYWTKCKRRVETKKADRAARNYVECAFGFDLRGAIHTVRINGYVTL